MKISIFNCVISLCLVLSACQNNKKDTLLTGSIGKAIQPIAILTGNELSDTTAITVDNKFRFDLNLEDAGYFRLKTNNNEYLLFLKPKDTLYINLIDGVIFNGNAKENNQYLFAKEETNLRYFRSLINLFNLTPTNFSAKIDSVFNLHYQALKKLNAQNYSTFISMEEKSLYFEKNQLKLEYASMSPNNYLVNTDKFLDFIPEAPINDSAYLNLPGYMYFLTAYINWLSYNKTKDMPELFAYEYTMIKMELITQNFKNGIIKDKLLYSVLNEHVRFKGLKNTEQLFETFLLQCKNNELKEKLTNPYEKYLSLNKGKKAPDFKLTNLNNETKTLQAFAGKYIYIDVWATWCKPCVAEAPYFEKLKEKHSHKNIKFISISVDNDMNRWLKFCKQHNKFDGQFWIENAQEFLDDYLIKTIPHFIIIDEEGHIVNVNANRPSDNENQWLDDLPEKPNV